jgi:hypothetical protein
VLRVRAYPSLLIVLMGSLDCLTTVIGIIYFGAVESNPFLISVVSTNISAFVVLKVVTTIFVGIIFYIANKILLQTNNKSSRAFVYTRYTLITAYIGVIVFLVIVVSNNLLVLAHAI